MEEQKKDLKRTKLEVSNCGSFLQKINFSNIIDFCRKTKEEQERVSLNEVLLILI
jgi:hypothetical protein